MTRTRFLKSLRALLAYHRSCGIEHYPGRERLRPGLKALDALLASGSEPDPLQPGRIEEPLGPAPGGMRPAPPQAGHEGGNAPAAPISSTSGTISLEELSREIAGCRICALNELRKISTPGRGGLKPRLLIVGDWLVHGDTTGENELFGTEQDTMLDNMVRAMGLTPDEVFTTNVIKCSVDPSRLPEGVHLSACVNYLKQQIGLLRPRTICTMGPAASQTLLDRDDSLIALRGTFHQYVLADGTGIPVMPTFHPTYLLKNPEMKKPTWSDLLAVKKQLESVR